MTIDAQALAGRALDTLQANGATGDVYIETRTNLSLRVRDGALEGITRAEIRGVAVRAMKNGRLGFVHTADATDAGVSSAAERAAALSSAASTRDDLLLAPAGGPGDGSDEGEDLRLYDTSLDDRPVTEKTAWLVTAEAAARDVDPRITRSESTALAESRSERWLANTRGLFRHYRRSNVTVTVEVAAEEGEDKQQGYREFSAVRWRQLPDPLHLGRDAGEYAIALLGGRPVPTARVPVVFRPSAGFAPLLYVATALDGQALAEERSWLTGRGDEPIGSSLVTIRDDGRRRSGVGAAPFDDEGVDTRKTTLVDHGRVSGAITDLASAKRLGRRSTGNAIRNGYDALPRSGMRNLYLEAGEHAPADILASVTNGFWVWGLRGWWIGNDPSNPAFSSDAFGLWIENGRPTHPVARVTIAAPLDELLSRVDMVGTDLRWEGNVATPTYRVSDVAVSGV